MSEGVLPKEAQGSKRRNHHCVGDLPAADQFGDVCEGAFKSIDALEVVKLRLARVSAPFSDKKVKAIVLDCVETVIKAQAG